MKRNRRELMEENDSSDIDEAEPLAKRANTADGSTSTSSTIVDNDDDTVVNKLVRLLEPCEDETAVKTDFSSHFDSLAQFLTQQVVIQVAGSTFFRLSEIEFYYTTKREQHKDPFTHKHPYQKLNGRWYFHRSTHKLDSAYKGGSYKGLDISIGNDSKEIYGGVLIRSVLQYKNKNKWDLIEGPCKWVDTILKLNKSDSIDNLVSKRLHDDLGVEANTDVLSIRLKSSLTEEQQNELFPSNKYTTAHKGPRVGLTLKKTDNGADRKYYIMKPYRYYTAPTDMKKGKPLMVLSQFHSDYFSESKHGTDTKQDDDDIKVTDAMKRKYNGMFGVAPSSVAAYLKDFQTGRKLTASQADKKFVGKALSTSLLCELAGYCGCD